MSRQNVELVRRGYQLLAERGGVGIFALELAAPDVEIDFSTVYPDGPVIRGAEEFARFSDSAPWGRSLAFDPEEFIDVDRERVLVLVRVRATGQASGVPVENRSAHLFTVRDGKIARVQIYADQDEAREAVGLT
jgi:ketosteroid isomerase-like protein